LTKMPMACFNYESSPNSPWLNSSKAALLTPWRGVKATLTAGC